MVSLSLLLQPTHFPSPRLVKILARSDYWLVWGVCRRSYPGEGCGVRHSTTNTRRWLVPPVARPPSPPTRRPQPYLPATSSFLRHPPATPFIPCLSTNSLSLSPFLTVSSFLVFFPAVFHPPDIFLSSSLPISWFPFSLFPLVCFFLIINLHCTFFLSLFTLCFFSYLFVFFLVCLFALMLSFLSFRFCWHAILSLFSLMLYFSFMLSTLSFVVMLSFTSLTFIFIIHHLLLVFLSTVCNNFHSHYLHLLPYFFGIASLRLHEVTGIFFF